MANVVPSMSRYTSATDADQQAMLDAIGVGSLEELFADIPQGCACSASSTCPTGSPSRRSTSTWRRWRRATATPTSEVTFLGAGMYDHYVPALIDTLLSRSEFLTPVHALPAGDLPGRAAGDVRVPDRDLGADRACRSSNASVYEGPSAVAAAGYLAKLETKRTKLVASRGLHPHSRAALRTHAAGYGMTVEEVAARRATAPPTSRRSPPPIDDDTAAVFVQQPNFLGTVEELGELAEAGKRTGALRRLRRRPAAARRSCKPPGELRRRHLRRRGPDARQPARLRRPVASASSPPQSASSARCPAGSPARRATSTAAAASC